MNTDYEAEEAQYAGFEDEEPTEADILFEQAYLADEEWY